MKITIGIFLTLLLLTLFVHAEEPSCRPSANSCELYSCMEQRMQCGSQGYLAQFGGPLCQRFLDTQENTTPDLQKWYPKVRLCLQQTLMKLQQHENCQEFGDQAFASHFDCYVSTGFCDLNWADKLEIFQVAGPALLQGPAIETGVKIEEACAQIHAVRRSHE